MGFGGVIKLQGESEYMRALKVVTQQLKTLSSEMKIVDAEFGKNNKSIDSLTARNEVLNKKLVEQRRNYEHAKSTLASLNEQQAKNDKAQGDLILKYERAKVKLDELKNSTTATTREIAEAKRNVEMYSTLIQINNDVQSENVITIKKVEAEMNKAEADIKSITREIENNNKEMAKGETAYSKLTTTISSQESELKKLKQEYVNVVLEQGKGSTEAKNLMLKIKDLDSELTENKNKLNEAEQSLGKFSDGEKEAGEGALSLGDMIKANVISDAIMGGLRKLGDILMSCARKVVDFTKESIEVGASFEAGMSTVSALSKSTGEELDDLTNKAIEMGKKTKFTVTESTEAFKYMALAGWDAHEMIDGISGVMSLAAASGEELKSVTDIVTDSMTAFGWEAKRSTEFADIMARTVTGANTTVEELGEAYKYCSTTAGALNYDIKDVNLALGLMADSSLKGSQAGTSLRSMMTRLAANTNDARTTLEGLGVQVINQDGSMRNLGDVIRDIRPAFDKLSESEKSVAAQTIAGTTGMAGLLAIANSTPQTFEKVTKALNDTKVTAESMANTMLDNLQGATTKFKSTLEVFQLTLYEKIDAPLKNVVQEATTSLGNLETAFKENGFSGLVEQLGVELANWTTKIVEFLPTMAEQGASMIQTLLDGLQSQLPNIAQCSVQVVNTLLTKFIEMLPQLLQVGMDLLVQLALGISKALPNLIPTAVNCIMTLLETIYDNFPAVLDAGIQLLVSLAEGIMKSLPQLVAKAPVVIEKWVGAVIQYSPRMIAGALQIMLELAKGVVSFIPELVGKIPQIINELVNGFNKYVSNMRNIGSNLLKGVWEGISSWASELQRKVSGLCSNIVGWFKGAFGIHSPSTVFADAIGVNIGKGIEVGYEKEMSNFGDIIKDSIPTGYDFDMNANVNSSIPSMNNSISEYGHIVKAFKQALGEMKIEMDGDEMGNFVDKTVTKLVYAY
nr:MAG TPA: minor tail protein [Caudoviricetes sp.]